MTLLEKSHNISPDGDARLRKQGYERSGIGLLERQRQARTYWAPHLERNKRCLLDIAQKLRAEGGPGGTLVILGAGRLLDVPWETLFPQFERVVLYDADSSIVPFVERLFSSVRHTPFPPPRFEIGDLTGSVVDTAAWAGHTIERATSPEQAATALLEGFQRGGAESQPWAGSHADLRMVVSTNLMSQLGYFPRAYIQREFRTRFKQGFADRTAAAEALECYFDRVRARHVSDIAAQKNAWAFLSSDVETITYELEGEQKDLSKVEAPPGGGAFLDDKGGAQFHWPVKITGRSDPLHGQKIRNLWPDGTPLDPPQRWIWHIVPQGLEKRYTTCGRTHVVEAWTKRSAEPPRLAS